MWDQKQTFSTSAYFKPSVLNKEKCVPLFQRTGKDLFFWESCSPRHPFFCSYKNPGILFWTKHFHFFLGSCAKCSTPEFSGIHYFLMELCREQSKWAILLPYSLFPSFSPLLSDFLLHLKCSTENTKVERLKTCQICCW